MRREDEMKRLCFSCKKQSARMLKTKRSHYTGATEQAVFCTQACAADWALLQVGPSSADRHLYFCKTHGWDDQPGETCVQCEGDL